MKYNEWRDELKNNLLGVSESERARVLDYYAEAYADRREAGFSEREIIDEFGAPFDAAQRILADAPKTEVNEQSEQPAPAPTPSPAPVTPAFVPQTAAATTATAVKKKKSNLGWIIPLICGAVILGVCFFVIIPVKYACRFFKNSIVTMTSYTAEEDYTAVKINAERCSVRTEFYNGDKITVDYPVIKGYQWSISNADGDGLLTLSSNMPSNYLTLLGSVNIPDAVIKLPENVLFDVEVETAAGSVTLANGNYNNIKVDLAAGSFYANTVTCESINCKINAGSFYADSMTCNDIRCDINAGEINIDELTCNSLTASVDMGSLEIGMTGLKSEYTISAVCNMGSSNLSTQTGSSDKKIDVSVSMGSLEVTFDN
ncbi:MAG: DUF4097 family beta strand repeat-containing protein [Clostridia bacterium]|nr:DUF4097 family beta strand repeat-containing protein [Clostridia bacterium]